MRARLGAPRRFLMTQSNTRAALGGDSKRPSSSHYQILRMRNGGSWPFLTTSWQWLAEYQSSAMVESCSLACTLRVGLRDITAISERLAENWRSAPLSSFVNSKSQTELAKFGHRRRRYHRQRLTNEDMSRSSSTYHWLPCRPCGDNVIYGRCVRQYYLRSSISTVGPGNEANTTRDPGWRT
jgi:hypothetical protein